MMAKSSICLTASLLLFKLVTLFFPSLRRCIHSHSLLKTKQQQQQSQTRTFKLLDNEEEDATVRELPDHLLESILLPLLPVKSLLRFRSLSKQWNFTISNNMINISHVIYLDCSAQNRFFFPSQYAQLQAASIPDAAAAGLGMCCYPPPRLVKKRIRIDVKSRIFMERSLYMSSCNGVVCFIRTTRSSLHDMCIKVMNIATRSFRQVPTLPDYLLYMMRSLGIWMTTTMLGFGYDSTIDDFKIVFIFRFKFPHGRCFWITQVMWLKKTNTWKETDCSSSNSKILSRVKSCQDGHSVAVAGNVLWIVTLYGNAEERVVLKFSLADERLEFISFPNREQIRATYKLSYYDGSLYLTIQNGNYASRMDLWKLPMSNSSYVWNKVTTITIPTPPPPGGRNIIGFSSCLPLGFDSNGHVIIVMEGVLYAYILRENKLVKLLDSFSNCRYLHLVQTQSLAACP